MQWYVAENNQPVGPLTQEVFDAKIKAGTVLPETLVWNETMKAWAPYRTIQGPSGPASEPALLVPEPAAAETPASANCCECQRPFPMEDLVAYEGKFVCAACKDTFFQRVQEGVTLPGIYEYAGFWIRFAAKFIDGLILGVVNMVFSFMGGIMSAIMIQNSSDAAILVQLVLFVIQMTIQIAYATWFVGRYGRTPGKMACKLKIIRADGSPVSYSRACGRFFAEMLSGIILYIGYLMAAFDDEKRTLHDRICDTRVIRTDV